ncbi:MAG: HAMP domain-containing sensor histidine kinase [Candidatus Nitrosotenuis sp.]
MKEFSNEELIRLLVQKIKELRWAKEETDELNTRLKENMAKLEETQRALSQQRDQLREEVKQKTNRLLKVERFSTIGQLSARIAHDLRNPLNVIQNSSEILKVGLDGKLDEKSQDQWARLDRAVYRMSHQLEDVMDYVRMPQIKKKNYPLSMVLHYALERISVPQKITIQPPMQDHMVFCDPEKLEIVFVNLLVNAIEAIEENEGKITIEASDDVDGKFSTIAITDTGIGIPGEFLGKIFEPLFTTKRVGTGLGLSSCKSIVEQHGGTISASSVLGGGSRFTIRIPVQSVVDDAADDAADQMRPTPAQ